MAISSKNTIIYRKGNKILKKIIKEINENKNLETNLPAYADYLMNLYNKKAAVEFSMDYYTLFEIVGDGKYKDDNLKDMVNRFNNIVRNYVVSPMDAAGRENALKLIDELRNDIYDIVDILAAYADIFARYEYVSNRCEYLFKDTCIDVKDEALTRDIMNYIFSDEDNSVINSKISEIVAELPLRMTKNKFFELLNEGLSVYNKTDKETIDDFLYILKSSSMLVLPEKLSEYDELFAIYNEIKSIDYKNITEEQFKKLEASLRYVTDLIDEETNIFMILQEIVNRAYVLIIANKPLDESDKETEMSMKIIKAINENFTKGEYLSLPDEISDMFVFLEGVPENILYKVQRIENVLVTVRTNDLDVVKAINSDNIYRELFVSADLLSDSLFVNLSDDWNAFEKKDKDMTEDFNPEQYIEKMMAELKDLLMDFFNNNPKMVNRSVMSLILSKLPVFFNNVTEIQDYVYNSLSNCTNKAEKCAVIEIIRSIINII